MWRMSSDVIPSGGLLMYFLRSSSISGFVASDLLKEDYIIEYRKRDQAEEGFLRDLDIALSYNVSRDTRL